jgi:hypothetical protein
MATVNLPSVGSGWHSLGLAFDGNRIRVYYDGDELIDLIDNGFDGSAPFASGGISLDSFSATQPVSWDDVVVRTPSTYASQGQLVSSAFDGGASVDWRSIDWDASTPPATGVCIRTRTADDAAGLATASWSDCVAQSGVDISSADKRWIQYRVDLNSSSTTSTPRFRELRIGYTN